VKRSLGFLSLLALGGALSCVLAFQRIGSRVDARGVLHEPFFLLPSSVGLASVGLALGMAFLFWSPSSKRR
jgi:hypothetical protein